MELDEREVTGHILEMRQDVASLTEQIKAAFKRIDEQKALTETVHELALSLRDLTNAQKNSSSAIAGLQKDVEELKQKPGKRWDAVVAQVITLIIAAFVGGLIGKIV